MPAIAQNTSDVSPARQANAVTPHDANSQPGAPFRSLYVAGAGNVAIVDLMGVSTTFVGIPAGFILPVWCTRVLATGTTATGIVGLG